MKLKSYLLSGLLLVGMGSANAQSTTYNFTGGIQTFTVPCGVDTIFIQSWGAQGGAGALGGNSVAGGNGGLGGYAEGWLVVNPGDVLNIFVGGQGATPTGGFNGGANGGSQNAGGGRGASDVRVGGTAESNRVITAGGGKTSRFESTLRPDLPPVEPEKVDPNKFPGGIVPTKLPPKRLIRGDKTGR